MYKITNPENIKNILIVRMNKIGDMICTIPLIRTLRANFKNAKITVFTEEPGGELLEKFALVDGVITFRRHRGFLSNKYVECLRILRKYKKERKIDYFDIAIAVKGGFSSFSSSIAFMSGAHLRIGYTSPDKRYYNILYNLPVNPIDFTNFHQVDACLNLLSVLGIDNYVRDISLNVPDEYKTSALKFLKENGLKSKDRIAVFNISNNRETSKWREENFTELGREINKKLNYKCVITCVAEDRDRAFKICQGLNGNGIYYETPSLMDIMTIVSLSDFLVAGDGGAIHIGAAVGTKVIALFGRTNPIIYGPYGKGHVVLKSKDGNVNSINPDEVIKVVMRFFKSP